MSPPLDVGNIGAPRPDDQGYEPVMNGKPLDRQDVTWVLFLAAELSAIVWATNLRFGTLIRGDLGVFFVPSFEFLGAHLRQGQLPAWNPHQFSGAPFIGDPGSGWGYLLAMLPFLIPNLVAAVSVYMMFHVVLGGTGVYLLARLLGLHRSGAIVAATAYAATWLVDRSSCCPAWVGLAAWLPILLVGVELSARQTRIAARSPGWIISAIALTQIATSWMGQGLYYVLLLLGGYCLFRVLAFPRPLAVWQRLVDALMLAAVPAILGGLLGAFALVPMLNVNNRSTLARGQYDVAVAAVVFERPLSLEQVWDRLTSSSLLGQWWYAGGAVIVLAAASLFIATGWSWRWFFLITVAGAIALSVSSDNLVLNTLYQFLPGFRELHGHQPYRALMLVYLPLSLLAGATADSVIRKRCTTPVYVGGVAIGVALTLGLTFRQLLPADPNELRTALSALGVLIVLVQLFFFPPRVRTVGLAVLVSILVWDPLAPRLLGDPAILNRTNVPPVSLEEMAKLPAAATWLRKNSADGARFFGYDEQTMSAFDAHTGAYRRVGEQPEIWKLIPNDLATLYGVDTVQGYNPSISRRYTNYFTVMNGLAQEYHEANVFPAGLASPLLDLLGTRFVVIPAGGQNPGPAFSAGKTVYSDASVDIVERSSAFPRSWLVDRVVVALAGQAAAVMTATPIDYRSVAVVETPIQITRRQVGIPPEPVVFERVNNEDARFHVETDTAALLVIGQSYDPGWTALIDDRPADVLPVNEALTGVVVPPGSKEVEMVYAPPSIRTGAIISLVTASILGLLLIASRSIRLSHRTRSPRIH